MPFLTALKSRLPKKRWKRALLYTASTLFIALAIDMSLTAYWRRITISKETTFLTTPLLPEGTPDYVTWLNDRAAEGVTPQNNAAVPLVIAFGIPVQPDLEARLLHALGLSETHIDPKMLYFPTWADDQSKNGGKNPAAATQPWAAGLDPKWSDEETAMRRAPWKAADHSLWAQWLSTQSETLSLAHDAAGRRRYFMPAFPNETPYHPGQVSAAILPTLGKTRYVGHMLIADAMMHAGDQDKQIVLRDFTDCLRLGALLRFENRILITTLVGEAMMQESCTAIQATLASGDLDPDSARQLLAAMNAVPPMPTVDLTGERCSLLDLWCAEAVYGLGRMPFISAEPPTAQPLIAALVPVRFDAQLRLINQSEDQLQDAMRIPTYQKRVQAVGDVQRDMLRRLNRAVLVFSGYSQVSSSVGWDPVWAPNTCAGLQTSASQRDLTRIALALAIHHSANNAYPPTLDALAPILSPIPLDGFNDQPFLYHPDKTGYLLYSIGRDLHDDSGDPDKDLVIRMEH